jgi:hypothetical protein
MLRRTPFIVAAMAAAVAIAACDSRPVAALPDDDEAGTDASAEDAATGDAATGDGASDADAGDAEGG